MAKPGLGEERCVRPAGGGEGGEDLEEGEECRCVAGRLLEEGEDFGFVVE